MTSFVIKEGKKVVKFECPVCGQIEGYFAGEDPVEVRCHNCGCLMIHEKVVDPNPEPEPEETPEPQPKEMKPVETPVEEPLRRKPGRPPKLKGSCSSCKKALITIGGFTCEEDWKIHKGDHVCNMYKYGKPVD